MDDYSLPPLCDHLDQHASRQAVLVEDEDDLVVYAPDDKSLAAQIARNHKKIRHFSDSEVQRFQKEQKPDMTRVIDLAKVAQFNKRRQQNWKQLEKALQEQEHKGVTVGRDIDWGVLEGLKGDGLRRAGAAQMKSHFISQLFQQKITFEYSKEWERELLAFLGLTQVTFLDCSDIIQVPEKYAQAASAFNRIETKKAEFCVRYEKLSETKNAQEFTLYGELVEDVCRLLYAVTVDHIVKASYVSEISDMAQLMITYGDRSTANRILFKLGLYFYEAARFCSVECFRCDSQNTMVQALCEQAIKLLGVAAQGDNISSKEVLEKVEAFKSIDMGVLVCEKYIGLETIAKKNLEDPKIRVNIGSLALDVSKASWLERIRDYLMPVFKNKDDEEDEGVNIPSGGLLTQSVLMLGASIAQEMQVKQLFVKLEEKQELATKLIYGVRDTHSPQQYEAYARFVGTVMMALKCMLEQGIIEPSYVDKLEEVCAFCEGLNDNQTSIYIHKALGEYFHQVARAFEAKGNLDPKDLELLKRTYDEARSFYVKLIEQFPVDEDSSVLSHLSRIYVEELAGAGRRFRESRQEAFTKALEPTSVDKVLQDWKADDRVLSVDSLSRISWDIDEIAYNGGIPYVNALTEGLGLLDKMQKGENTFACLKEFVGILGAIEDLGDKDTLELLLKRLIEVLDHRGQTVYNSRMIGWYSVDEKKAMAHIYETLLVVLLSLESPLFEEYSKRLDSYKNYFQIPQERLGKYQSLRDKQLLGESVIDE